MKAFFKRILAAMQESRAEQARRVINGEYWYF